MLDEAVANYRRLKTDALSLYNGPAKTRAILALDAAVRDVLFAIRKAEYDFTWADEIDRLLPSSGKGEATMSDPVEGTSGGEAK